MERSDSQERIPELLELAKAGDQQAWNRLYVLYEADIHKRVRAKLSPAHREQLGDSIELVQSVWSGAVQGLENFEYRGDGSFLAWVSGILRHKIEKRIEDARRREAILGGTEGLGILAARALEGSGPGTKAEKQEQVAQLRRALDELDEKDREILLLARFDGLKNREIGERLGISEDAARMRVTRAWYELVHVFERARDGSSGPQSE